MIQSLRETVGAEASLVNTFDAFRKKRNVSAYDRAGLVSDADAGAMRALAQQLRRDVEAWLKRSHPVLIN